MRWKKAAKTTQKMGEPDKAPPILGIRSDEINAKSQKTKQRQTKRSKEP